MKKVSLLDKTVTLLGRKGSERVLSWLMLLLLLVLPLGHLPSEAFRSSLTMVSGLFQTFVYGVYLHDLIIGSFVITWSLTHLNRALLNQTRSFLATNPWIQSALIITSVSFLNAAINGASLIPLFYGVRLSLYVVFVVIAAQLVTHTKIMAQLVLLSLVGTMYFALLQYLLIPDVRFLSALGWDDHYYRAVGTIMDPNFTGSLAVLTLWMVLGWRRLFSRYFTIFTILLSLGVLLATFSRASYVAAIVSGAYLSWHFRHRVSRSLVVAGLTVMAVGIAILFFLLPKPGGEGVNLLRTASITARIENSLVPFQEMTLSDWIFGRGLYRPLSETTMPWVPDNLVALIITGTGLVGLILGIQLWRAYSRHLKSNVWLGAVWVAVLVHAQFNNTLLEPFHVLYLGLITAVMVKKP